MPEEDVAHGATGIPIAPEILVGTAVGNPAREGAPGTEGGVPKVVFADMPPGLPSVVRRKYRIPF